MSTGAQVAADILASGPLPSWEEVRAFVETQTEGESTTVQRRALRAAFRVWSETEVRENQLPLFAEGAE